MSFEIRKPNSAVRRPNRKMEVSAANHVDFFNCCPAAEEGTGEGRARTAKPGRKVGMQQPMAWEHGWEWESVTGILQVVNNAYSWSRPKIEP